MRVVVLCLLVLYSVSSCEDANLGVGTEPAPVSAKIKGLPKQLQRAALGQTQQTYTFVYSDSTQQLVRVDIAQKNTKTTYSLIYNAEGRLSVLRTPVSSIDLVYQNQQLLRTKEIRGDSTWIGSYSYAPTGQPTFYRYTRNLISNENNQTTLYSFAYNWQGNNLYQLIQRGTQAAYDEITIEASAFSSISTVLPLFFTLTHRPTARWLSPNLPTTEVRLFEGKTLVYEASFTSDNKLQHLKIKDTNSKNIVEEEETWQYY